MKLKENGFRGCRNDAVGAVVAAFIVTVSVALSGAGVDAGEKEHKLDCGAPVQEKVTDPLNVPFTGCTLKANCAGCPAWTVREGVNETI